MLRMSIVIALIMSMYAVTSHAQAFSSSKDEAKWMLERITGIHHPANSSIIQQMAQKIDQGDRAGAAHIATSQSSFLNVTVKLMALGLSTREETIRQKLNDFAASFIGVTRDERDARELLSGNFYYDGDPAKIPTSVRVDLVNDLLKSNNHYSDLDNSIIDIAGVLRRVEGQQIFSESANAAVANPDPAGVLTSRAFLGAHASDGTNRRLVEYTFREFMCVRIENWADTNASDNRIGRDIDRFPGGDNLKFMSTCKGCHTQMDGFRGAFAFWDFDNGHSQNSAVDTNVNANGTTKVMNKMNKNNTVYPGGYVMTDNTFINNSNRGNNTNTFGWRNGNIASGVGVKEFGTLVSNSRRFSECMSKRVFEAVCNRGLSSADESPIIDDLRLKFESSKYNLRSLFEYAVLHKSCHI